MDLYKEILVKALEQEKAYIIFPNLNISAKEIVELKCYNAIKEIKKAIEKENITDKERFEAILKIISILESLGTSFDFLY